MGHSPSPEVFSLLERMMLQDPAELIVSVGALKASPEISQ
jgi:hypothetical protein